MERIHQILNKMLDEILSQEEMHKLGLAGIRIIKQRTAKGLDVEGHLFEPYSESYRETREAAGLPTGVVNLEFDDIQGMLTYMEEEPTGDGEAEIDIFDPEKSKLAFYHDESGVGKIGNKIRHFWGFSDAEEEKLRDLVAGDITRVLTDLSEKLSD